ncbi:YciI family protein [Leifsonia virtsii]|uniref:YciI family protein n=1 Tax=Leifsonia virtsii TaxID=3035915 RepID=A0ABT8IWI6_9MICO|nr:YciI family protein [Leifsonia virtsii]MDN4597176.1 YciI family protein [Leifsonia virtsii]
MPLYAIFIHFDPSAEHDAAELAEHDRHSDDLIRAGALVAAYALTPPETARSLRADGETDGPYTESKELIAGIGIVEASDREAALALARQNPAMRHGSGVEVREVAGAYLRETDTASASDVTAG